MEDRSQDGERRHRFRDRQALESRMRSQYSQTVVAIYRRSDEPIVQHLCRSDNNAKLLSCHKYRFMRMCFLMFHDIQAKREAANILCRLAESRTPQAPIDYHHSSASLSCISTPTSQREHVNMSVHVSQAQIHV
jgi:hypothetical protein